MPEELQPNRRSTLTVQSPQTPELPRLLWFRISMVKGMDKLSDQSSTEIDHCLTPHLLMLVRFLKVPLHLEDGCHHQTQQDYFPLKWTIESSSFEENTSSDRHVRKGFITLPRMQHCNYDQYRYNKGDMDTQVGRLPRFLALFVVVEVCIAKLCFPIPVQCVLEQAGNALPQSALPSRRSDHAPASRHSRPTDPERSRPCWNQRAAARRGTATAGARG